VKIPCVFFFGERMFMKDSSSTSSPGASSYSSVTFAVGEEVYAFFAEAKWWRRANVLAVRNTGDTLEYYIHFYNMNRRNDRWLGQEYVRSEPGSDDDESMTGAPASDGSYSDESDHEGMTQQDIQEWERATKVKRINKIMLGKYLVETWYWSPYPKSTKIVQYCIFVNFVSRSSNTRKSCIFT